MTESACRLIVKGDGLDPEEVTLFLGKAPSLGRRKGERWRRAPRAQHVHAHTGIWQLEANRQRPVDLDAQISKILAGASEDLTVWRMPSKRFEVSMFVGLVLEESNEGRTDSPEMTAKPSARSIVLDLDIYDGCDD